MVQQQRVEARGGAWRCVETYVKHVAVCGNSGDPQVVARVVARGASSDQDLVSKVKVNPHLCYIYFMKMFLI